MLNSIRLFIQQLRSIFRLISLSIRHKKDFLIVETYSFNEASKIGEFTFTPRVFFILGGIFSFFIILITIAVIQFTPLGFALLGHQKHPLEDDFAKIAQRVQVLNDSLASSNAQLDLFKQTIRGLDGSQLAYSEISPETDDLIAFEEDKSAGSVIELNIDDYFLLYSQERQDSTIGYISSTFAKNNVSSGQNLNLFRNNFAVPYRLEFIAPN